MIFHHGENFTVFLNSSMCDLLVIFTLLDFSILYFYFWHGTCLVCGRSLLGILQSVVIWTEGQNKVSFWANKTSLFVLKLTYKQRQTHMNEKCTWDGSSIRRWNQNSVEVCDNEVPSTWWAFFVCQQQVQGLVVGIRETRFSRFAQLCYRHNWQAVALSSSCMLVVGKSGCWQNWMWKIRSPQGKELPTESMLSELPACSQCPVATTEFIFLCYLSQSACRHQNLCLWVKSLFQ